MKKLFFVFCGVIFISPVSYAVEIQNVITDSVQLTVNGSGTQSTRMGSSYAVSGNNISASTMGGLSASTAGAAATLSAGSYTQTTDGQAFSFNETVFIGDDDFSTQTVDDTSGLIETQNTYGDVQIISGGTAGNLEGTLSATGIATVTAGGQGTTVLGQRTVTLSVFD